MKIVGLGLRTLELPLLRPLRISFGVVDQRPTLIVEIHTADGLVGYGESSLLNVPISEPETLPVGRQLLIDRLVPALSGREFATVDDFSVFLLELLPDNPVTRIGVEGAFYHAQALSQGRYVGEYFGQHANTFTVFASLGIESDYAVLVREARRLVGLGYTALKMKIEPGYAEAAVAAVRKALPGIELAVDANASFGAEDIDQVAQLDRYHLLFIEQPFAGQDLASHVRLQRMVRTRVCLDESILSLEDMQAAIVAQAGRVVNIKPARIGSYVESQKIALAAQAAGWDVFGGGRLESGIGKAMNVALARMSAYTLPLDLSSSSEYFAGDVTEPRYEVAQGVAVVPEQIGLGLTPVPALLEQYTSDYKLLEVA